MSLNIVTCNSLGVPLLCLPKVRAESAASSHGFIMWVLCTTSPSFNLFFFTPVSPVSFCPPIVYIFYRLYQMFEMEYKYILQ